MKAIKILILVVAVFCGIAYLLPKDFEVNRTIEIESSVSDIFYQASNLSNWANWSAWHEMDPDAAHVYSSPDYGVGASYSWNGDPKKIAEGELTIIEIEENKSMRTNIVFFNEGEETGRGNGQWVFSEKNGKTHISWSFMGDMGYNPLARWMGLLIDGMLGPQLETGLSNMKIFLESKDDNGSEEVAV